MKSRVLLVMFLIGFLASPLLAQSSDSASKISFVRELDQLSEEERQTRKQLENLLSGYDLSPWLHKRKVKIESSSIGESGSDFITLSTDHLGDELGLLSEFIHEQIHRIIFEKRLKERNAAIREFQSLYPDAPSERPEGGPNEFATYMHLVINWLELDAMTELVGKETARRLTAEEGHYTWINEKVLGDTDEIGTLLAKHDLLLTPEKGLVVEIGKEWATENRDYYCFGRSIVAPASGRVVVARDTVPDNETPFSIDNRMSNQVAIAHGDGEYSILTHLRHGSVIVEVGQRVKRGENIGECGNSRSSQFPDLDYRLVTDPDPREGTEILAQFVNYRSNGRPVGRGTPVRGQYVSPR